MFFTKVGRVTAKFPFFGGLALIVLGVGILVVANIGSNIAYYYGINEYLAFVAYGSGILAVLVGILLGILSDISATKASEKSEKVD